MPQAGLRQLLWLETLAVDVDEGPPAVAALLRQLVAASGLTADLRLVPAEPQHSRAAHMPPPFQLRPW